MRTWQAGFVLAALVLTSAASAQQKARVDVDVQLKAAMQKELVDGDLKGAIAMYEKIVADAGGNRAVAAKALLAIGQCYEKLGDTEARKAYDRLVREYADQGEVTATARARLAAMGIGSSRASATGPTTRQVWAGPDGGFFGSVSSDGRYLSYVEITSGNLAMRDLGTGEIRRLTSTGSWSGAFAEDSRVSPDARHVAYTWYNEEGFYELRLVGRDGDQPRVLYRDKEVRWVEPFEWSPDGKQIAALLLRRGSQPTHQLVLVSAVDGSVRVLKALDWRSPTKMAFSPDGRFVAYDLPPAGNAPERDVFVLATDGSREVPLVQHPSNDFLLGWFPEGDRVLFGSDRLGTNGAWAIRVADGKPQGEAELLKPDIGAVTAIGFTKNGEYFYGQSRGMPEVYIATMDPATGKVVDGPMPFRVRYGEQKTMAVWSADGEHLAYLAPARMTPGTMSILTIKTGQVRDFPLKVSSAGRLTWMPDGRSVIVGGSDLEGRNGLFRLDLSTGGLAPIVYDAKMATVSPDGGTLFYVKRTGVVMRDLGSGQEKMIYESKEGFFPQNTALSPDGHWLAVKTRNPTPKGPSIIQLVPTSGGEPRLLWDLDSLEANAHFRIAWSIDSRHLLSFGARGELWRIPTGGGAPNKVGIAVAEVSHLSMHPDGRRMAISAGFGGKADVWAMGNLLPPRKVPK